MHQLLHFLCTPFMSHFFQLSVIRPDQTHHFPQQSFGLCILFGVLVIASVHAGSWPALQTGHFKTIQVNCLGTLRAGCAQLTGKTSQVLAGQELELEKWSSCQAIVDVCMHGEETTGNGRCSMVMETMSHYAIESNSMFLPNRSNSIKPGNRRNFTLFLLFEVLFLTACPSRNVW